MNSRVRILGRRYRCQAPFASGLPSSEKIGSFCSDGCLADGGRSPGMLSLPLFPKVTHVAKEGRPSCRWSTSGTPCSRRPEEITEDGPATVAVLLSAAFRSLIVSYVRTLPIRRRLLAELLVWKRPFLTWCCDSHKKKFKMSKPCQTQGLTSWYCSRLRGRGTSRARTDPVGFEWCRSHANGCRSSRQFHRLRCGGIITDALFSHSEACCSLRLLLSSQR